MQIYYFSDEIANIKTILFSREFPKTLFHGLSKRKLYKRIALYNTCYTTGLAIK